MVHQCRRSGNRYCGYGEVSRDRKAERSRCKSVPVGQMLSCDKVVAARVVGSSAKTSKLTLLLLDPRTYCWFALLVSLACLYRRLPSIPDTSDWISSDSLWPVNLITDIFVDRYPLSGWQFSVAPCWFPDVFLAGFMYAPTRNVLAATFLDGFAQFILLILCVCLCWRALRLPRALAAEVATLVAAIALTLYVATHADKPYGAWHQLFLPQTHVGNLVNLVLATLLCLHLLRDQSQRAHYWTLAAFLSLCVLASMSNLLFLTHFLVPATLGVGFLVARGDLTLRRALLVAAGWPAAFLGLAANRILFNVADVGGQSSIGWKQFEAALATFIRGAREQIAAADFEHLLALAWLIGCAAALWRLTNGRSKTPVVILRTFFFIVAAGASLFSAATIIAGGSLSLTTLDMYEWSLHYMHPMFLLPLFAWPVFIGLLPLSRRGGNLAGAADATGGRGTRQVAPLPMLSALASAVVAVIMLAATPAPAVPLHRYVPPLVKAMDAYAQGRHLKYGLASYWQARLITMLSTTGLRVYQVGANLQPFRWVNNIDWYTQSVENREREPLPAFALLGAPGPPITRGDVTAVLGEPEEEPAVAGVPFLVYLRNTEEARDIYCPLDVSLSRAAASGVLDFPGSCLWGSVGRAGAAAWIVRESDTAGSVRLPELPLTPGVWSLQIDYQARSSDNRVIVDVGYPNAESFLSSELPAGASRFDGRFTIPSQRIPSKVALRIFFEGFGEVEIRRLILRKQP